MREEKRPQNPMSIEQAGNFLKEKTETMAEDMKKEAKAAPISFADPYDRQEYLLYGIYLLNDISEMHKRVWCVISHRSPELYTTKQVAGIIRKLMILRINGFSVERIAHHLHETPLVVEQVEKLAITVIKEAIEKKRNTGIPLLG